MVIADFARRIDELAELGRRALSTTWHDTFGKGHVSEAAFGEFRAAGLSFLAGVFGAQHPYTTDFGARVRSPASADVNIGMGILQGAKGEVVGGWAVAAKTLVTAEIFSDFLEMSGHLLESGYKDAAAVMTGSVLEEHLRQLCRKHGVATEVLDAKGRPTAKKADTMNADLVAAGVYNKLDQKTVTAWLDLRNKAAHGKYTEYGEEQVKLMQQGVSEFMARVAP